MHQEELQVGKGGCIVVARSHTSTSFRSLEFGRTAAEVDTDILGRGANRLVRERFGSGREHFELVLRAAHFMVGGNWHALCGLFVAMEGPADGSVHSRFECTWGYVS